RRQKRRGRPPPNARGQLADCRSGSSSAGKKRGGPWPPLSLVTHTLSLLTDVTSTVLTPEYRSGLTDETAVVTAVVTASVVAVILWVEFFSEGLLGVRD